MGLSNSAYSDIADLNLWLKNQSNDRLTLADIQEIIPLRWSFIRDNWETSLLPDILSRLNTLDSPSLTKQQLDQFTTYVQLERTSSIPNNNPLSSSEAFFQFYLVFNAIFLDSAPTTAQEQTIVDNKIIKVRNYVKTDFIRIKNNVAAARDTLSDTVGGEDASYNEVYHRNSSPAQVMVDIPSLTQMQMYNNVIKTIDFILANLFALQSSFVDPFALARQNANNPDFNMDSYVSGTLVKLFVGEDLRSLASRYLGNPDKWIDIAIANGLKPPYIDEIGEALPLITNGVNDEIEISKLDVNGDSNIDKLYLNQIVFLQSDVQNFPDQRNIISIQEIPIIGNIVLTLSGNNDLSQYETVDNATLRIFAPSTINSQFLVLIPSTGDVTQQPSEIPYFLATAGQDLINAKVDLLLTSDNDLVFGSTNDFQLSYGLVNAIQAVKLKLLVEQGSLQRHREYGFINVQGTRNNNPNLTKSTIVAALNDQIRVDPRFDRIENLAVDYFGAGPNGPTGYLINMVVRMAGSATNIPISFSVNIS